MTWAAKKFLKLKSFVLKLKSFVLNDKFLRFLIIGVLNTIFGYSLYSIFVVSQIDPVIALGGATFVGALFNYLTTARYVFASSGYSKLPKFILSYAIIYLTNAGLLQFLLEIGFSPLWAQAVLVPGIAVMSFLIFNYFVFNTKNET